MGCSAYGCAGAFVDCHSQTAASRNDISTRGVFNFTTNGVEIEGPDGYGVDFQFPWENVTQRTHSSVLEMPPLWVDEFPVTNSQWYEYIKASSYVPADDTYYLAFWNKPGFNISGDDGYRPVTWVSPDEAGGTCGQRCIPHHSSSRQRTALSTAADSRMRGSGNLRRVDPAQIPFTPGGMLLPL